MKNKLINFAEGDGLDINERLLRDQVTCLEWDIVRCSDKNEEKDLRERLKNVRNALEINSID